MINFPKYMKCFLKVQCLILYSIFTADLLHSENVKTAKNVDDTLCLASDMSTFVATQKLQKQLIKINPWLQKWQIKSSTPKSVHVTFTLRKTKFTLATMGGEPL